MWGDGEVGGWGERGEGKGQQVGGDGLLSLYPNGL